MSTWNKIKEHWPQITALAAILLVLGGAYLEWRLSVNFASNLKSEEAALKINELIDLKLADVDLATDSKVIDMDSNIATNTAGVARNKEEIDDAETMLHDVAKILMGDKPGDGT